MWRLIVRFDASEAQALEATKAVKELLEPISTLPVGTITVAEWVWQDHDHQPKPRILRGQV